MALYITWAIIAFALVCILRTRIRLGEYKNELDREFTDLEHKVGDWSTRYVPPENEFLYQWSRESGAEDDFEIIEWCEEKNSPLIRFKYMWDKDYKTYSSQRNIINIWIKDRKLAMEFKLKWH